MAMRSEQNARVRLRGNTEIVAAGHYFPKDRVSNEDFFARCEFPITDDREALVRDTRMVARTWCGPDENTWTMAREAVRMAVRGIDASEIDLVVVSSCSTIPMVNYPDPSNGVMADLSPLVLAELGKDDGVGIDIKAGYCAGFLRGLEVCDAMLENPNYRAALLVASDVGGRFATAPSNRSVFCFLVGDSAGAVVLRKSERRGLVDHLSVSVPSKADLTAWGADGKSLIVKGQRTGAASFELMLDAGKRLLARNHITGKDLDAFLPAQTSIAMLEALADGLGIARHKLLWRGDETGYSASASIATHLSYRLARGDLRKGQLVLSLAAGAGMNAGGALYYC
jgi:3-oxoacyl-[acyl-carrier-protein] synthase-3